MSRISNSAEIILCFLMSFNVLDGSEDLGVYEELLTEVDLEDLVGVLRVLDDLALSVGFLVLWLGIGVFYNINAFIKNI